MVVKRVVETIRKQNDEFHFLTTFVKGQGFARWDKPLIYFNTPPKGGKGFATNRDTLVIIPLVKIDSSRVTAFLACAASDDSVVIRLFRADRFATYPISNNTDSLTSTFIAHQIMVLDYLTFGYSLFRVTDDRVFAYKNVRKEIDGSRLLFLRPRQWNNARTGGYVTIESCWEEYMPPTGYQTGGTPPGGENNYGHYETRCTYYSVWLQTVNTQSPFGSGGGGGGDVSANPGSSGSSVTPYFWNSDPCNDINSWQSPDVQCQDGMIGWQPIPPTVEWFNSLLPYAIDISGLQTYPCAQSVVQEVIHLNNSTIQTIKDIFSESVKYNIYFDTNITNPNANASTSPNPKWIPIPNGTNGPLTELDIAIHLNPSFLSEATKLSIAEAIIHEMIHGYFYYRSIDAFGDPIKTQELSIELGFLQPYNPNNPPSNSEIFQHQQMAQTYVEKIVLALKEYKLITDQDLNTLRNTYYPAATIDDFYKAMAWSGLYYTNDSSSPTETNAWHEFKEQDPNKAEHYLQIMTFETLGTSAAPSHEKCN